MAGFTDFERGERGSTAEHLTVLEYKTQQESERAAAIAAEVEQKREAAVALDEKTEKKQRQLDGLEKKTAIAKQEAADFSDIDAMPKKTLGGNIQLTPADWKKVSGFAKEGIKSRGVIAKLKEKITELTRKIFGLEKKLEGYEGRSITDTVQYYQARQRAPRRLAEAVADIMRQPPERTEPERSAPERKRTSYER